MDRYAPYRHSAPGVRISALEEWVAVIESRVDHLETNLQDLEQQVGIINQRLATMDHIPDAVHALQHEIEQLQQRLAPMDRIPGAVTAIEANLRWWRDWLVYWRPFFHLLWHLASTIRNSAMWNAAPLWAPMDNEHMEPDPVP